MLGPSAAKARSSTSKHRSGLEQKMRWLSAQDLEKKALASEWAKGRGRKGY